MFAIYEHISQLCQLWQDLSRTPHTPVTGMAGIFTFSIPDGDKEKIDKILADKRKKQRGSAWLVEAIKEKHQRETQTIIPEFKTPQLELDFLPNINEPLQTKEHLRQLSGKDLIRLYKMMHYNMSVIKKFIDTHEELEKSLGK